MNPYNIVAHVQYSLYRQCLSTGWSIHSRVIDNHELVLITGGEGRMITEQNVYTLKQGTLLYLYPGFRHALNSSRKNPMSFYGVHFNYADAEYCGEGWKLTECQKTLPMKGISEVSAYQKTEILFKRLNEYWNKKALGFEMICRGTLLEILYSVMQDSPVHYSSRRKVETVLTYINNHLSSKITIGSLAETVKWSPDYLALQFKEITGFTVIEYINQCRIDRAKVLLLDNDLKIKDVALKLGFCDEFYFSRVFKKQEGISPRAFRTKRTDRSFAPVPEKENR